MGWTPTGWNIRFSVICFSGLKSSLNKNHMISAELSLSELRYRRLFEAARDGILILDPETRQIVDVNPFMVEFLGYAHEDFIGKELYEIGLLKDEAASQAAFRELRSTGYIRYDDLPLETKNGRKVDVEFVSNLYEEGDQQVIQCNIRDISARKRAGLALRASEERFKLVARAVSDVVWDWNLVTGKLWWSDDFMTTFGYILNEIEPGIESWTSHIHPDERGRVVAGIHLAIDTGKEAWAEEYRFQRKDGAYALVQDRGYIHRDGAGKALRMVGGMRDLTEQKLLEAQSLRAQRMESIGTLSGGIAHDLNNVLTPIMMSIEMLQADLDDDPGRRKILEIIQVSCRRGADLLRQVLSFARGLNGPRVSTQLGPLIADLQGIICETFPRNITITAQVSDKLWSITGDPSQLHQVLLNLAVNARDAMLLHGGTLTFAANNLMIDAQYAGTSGAAKPGPYVLLRVTDTGVGIPLAVRQKIFERFYTTKETGRGTGLGLSTVHAIVKSHGGFIELESELDQGTTFKIFLPASPALPSAESAHPFNAGLSLGRDELVLVVDDESSIRLITQQTLEAFGYRVLTASNGAEAVALYAKQPQQIAIVLTDMMMPVMDGAAIIRVLKTINPAVKIIAASGIDSQENLANATKVEVQDFLAKPYTAKTLLKLIREVLDREKT